MRFVLGVELAKRLRRAACYRVMELQPITRFGYEYNCTASDNASTRLPIKLKHHKSLVSGHKFRPLKGL